MGVRIYPAPWKHPLECDVCDGGKRVTVRTVVRVTTQRRLWLPTRLALVVDCPQCTGADELAAHLPGDPAEQAKSC